MSNPKQILSLAATYVAAGQSEDLAVGAQETISIDVNCTALSGVFNFGWYRKGNKDGIYYLVWGGSLNATGQLSVSIGPGMEVPKEIGATGQLQWTISGGSPSATVSINVNGK